MKRFLLLLGIALVVTGVTLKLLQDDRAPAPPTASPEALRTTTSGPVIGFAASDDTLAWRGIPYAAAPTGELRWRAPRPPDPWREPLQALEYGAVCPQFSSLLGDRSGEAGDIVGQEDCLTLNVYAPRPADGSSRLPVMFWLHGGGNTLGSARPYNGSVLASDQQVVVVTIHYRLGVLGWLRHPALRDTASDAREASGNFSTLDMIAALEWVRDNIAAFGGDPDRVTLFGESAGGRNIFSLLASPLATGLFHGAIAQSGLPGTSTLERAENYRDDPKPGARFSGRELVLKWLQSAGHAGDREDARALQEGLPAKDLARLLRDLSLEELFEKLYVPGGMYLAPQLYRDGTVLPAEPLLSVFADPAGWNSVPLITGTNRDELKLFLSINPDYVSRWFGLIPRIRDPEQYEWRSSLLSDNWKAIAVDEVAEIIAGAEGSPPVFAYRFDWDEGTANWLVDLPQLLGAAHALELDFLWGPLLGRYIKGLFTDDNAAGRAELTRAMRGYWGRFAHGGDPGRGPDGDLPRWTHWRQGEGEFMLLDSPAGGGLRMSGDTVFAEDIKRRLRDDKRLAEASSRCAMYVLLFLDNGGVEQFFDTREYHGLGCAEFPPWSLADGNR